MTITSNSKIKIGDKTDGSKSASLTDVGLKTAQDVLLRDADGNSITNPVRKDLEGGGIVSIGTTAVEITFTGTTQSITIQSHPDNSGIIYIGKSNVTNLGANTITLLDPGDSIELEYNDTDNAVYAVSDTAAQQIIKGALL